jgi:hypothetical protein
MSEPQGWISSEAEDLSVIGPSSREEVEIMNGETMQASRRSE